MIRQLLDIPSVYPHRRIPRIRIDDTDKPVAALKDTITSAKDSLADTLSVDTCNAAAAVPGNVGMGGDDASMLMWTAMVVLGVLAMCFWFAYSYRKHHQLDAVGMR